MNISFEVQKVMCGGCTSNIEKNLNANEAITNVTVDVGSGRVDIVANEDVTDWAKAKCAELGFPEKETENEQELDPMAAFKAGALGK
jgi:copper chaperone CopZ